MRGTKPSEGEDGGREEGGTTDEGEEVKKRRDRFEPSSRPAEPIHELDHEAQPSQPVSQPTV